MALFDKFLVSLPLVMASEGKEQETTNATDILPVAEQTANTAGNTDLGILHLILNEGDAILKFTFIVLVLMSIYSWTVIIYRAIMTYIIASKSKKHLKLLNAKEYPTYAQAYQAMEGNSPIKDLVEEALNAKESFAKAEGAMSSSLDYAEYLQRNIRYRLEKATHSQDGGLSALATIGATAPFVGLFGTVWGIYRALISITATGNANIATIAGPIGEVLIATAFGLFVAIPAVLCYNVFIRRNRLFNRKLDGFAHDLYNSFLTKTNK
ncbi:MotA/TolQ/ExbB proton channel family protein [Psittacicella gerlachiana]|nr:MotA/TolQ/ExbB proton channel family protein [Psittacicella gerlachiana]